MRPFHEGLPAVLLLLTALTPFGGHAQPARTSPARPQAAAVPPTPPPAPSVASSDVPAVPQQTTASFGDWTLRCTRNGLAGQSCEVVQTISSEQRTVAQIALRRITSGQAMQLTILVPPNVSLGTAPALTAARDEAPAAELSWQRCLPGGCVAVGGLGDEALRRVRGWTEPARVTYPDAAGRAVTLPFSPRGLPQVLDALAKEESTG